MDLGGTGRLLLLMVADLKLRRWNVLAGTVETPAVVPVHPGERCQLDVLDRTPRTCSSNHFRFEETVERLSQGVVVRVTF